MEVLRACQPCNKRSCLLSACSTPYAGGSRRLLRHVVCRATRVPHGHTERVLRYPDGHERRIIYPAAMTLDEEDGEDGSFSWDVSGRLWRGGQQQHTAARSAAKEAVQQVRRRAGLC